jgi:hypothetical protein
LISLFFALISFNFSVKQIVIPAAVIAAIISAVVASDIGGMQEYATLKIVNSIRIKDDQSLFFIYPILVGILYVIRGGGITPIFMTVIAMILAIYGEIDLLVYRISFVFMAGLPLLLLYLSQNLKIDNGKISNQLGLIAAYVIAFGLWVYRMVSVDGSAHFAIFYQYGPMSSAITMFMK